MNNDTYESSLKYLFGLEKFGMVFGLENVRRLLRAIGDPQRMIQTVHIAGTNGKGSVATMVTGILKKAVYRVGKYTSPHLVSFTERITVNEREISEEEVASLTEYIREQGRCGGDEPFYTFFDFTTAMALEHFRRQKVEIAVIETGLGGRLDSTNVIMPLVSVVTNVAFDHVDVLGGTLGKIATEKAGIIKKDIPVITGARGGALGVIERRARQLASPLHVLGKDILYAKTGNKRFSYKGITKEYHDVTVNLNGDHQLMNAALALCAIEVLFSAGFTVREQDMRDALGAITWQGRLEVLHERPLVLLDGAHNVSGARAVAAFLHSLCHYQKKVLVFGVMKDKAYRTMLETLGRFVDCTILTQPKINRALAPERMEGYAKNAIVVRDIGNALKEAKMLAGEEDLILVTGSFCTIGEAKSAINEIF